MSKQKAKTSFSASGRKKLLGELINARKETVRLSAIYNGADKDKKDDSWDELNKAGEHLRQLIEKYEVGLPRIALSRCPFTGAPVNMAIDNFGLDGPWWDFESPVRPIEEFPPSVFAFSGAMNIKSRPPKTPFLCKPGPGAPFVVPRLLVNPAIKAVVSTIKIGNMTAWPVFYFAEDTPYDLIRINDWGSDSYMAETAHGEGYTMQTYDYYIDYDFDLEFYISTGRLLWIEPGDEELKLNSTVSYCPYLGLKGRDYPVALQNGKMWNSLIDEKDVEAAKQTA